jgi:hypothetical protein
VDETPEPDPRRTYELEIREVLGEDVKDRTTRRALSEAILAEVQGLEAYFELKRTERNARALWTELNKANPSVLFEGALAAMQQEAEEQRAAAAKSSLALDDQLEPQRRRLVLLLQLWEEATGEKWSPPFPQDSPTPSESRPIQT